MTIGYIIAYIISTLSGILVTFTCRFGVNPHPLVADDFRRLGYVFPYAEELCWIVCILCSIVGVIMIAVGVHGLASLIKTRKH